MAQADCEEANAVGRGCGSAQAEALGDARPYNSFPFEAPKGLLLFEGSSPELLLGTEALVVGSNGGDFAFLFLDMVTTGGMLA